MKDAHRRAQISQLVDVVLHAAGVEDCVGHQRRRHTPNGEAVRLGDAIDMIRRLPAAASRHVVRDDRRISRNIFLQKRKQRLPAQIAGAAGVDDLHHGDCFALVEIGLGISTHSECCANHYRQSRGDKKYSHENPPMDFGLILSPITTKTRSIQSFLRRCACAPIGFTVRPFAFSVLPSKIRVCGMLTADRSRFRHTRDSKACPRESGRVSRLIRRKQTWIP